MVNDNVPRPPQRPGLVSIAWHCSCGASCVFTAEPPLAEKMREVWERIHPAGPDHEPVPEDGATAARDQEIGAIENLAREIRWGRRPASPPQEV